MARVTNDIKAELRRMGIGRRSQQPILKQIPNYLSSLMLKKSLLCSPNIL